MSYCQRTLVNTQHQEIQETQPRGQYVEKFRAGLGWETISQALGNTGGAAEIHSLGGRKYWQDMCS